ncbi:hypothetical protein F-liban_255 [Faustovirus]|nr:hypothetical protein F-liban_255 [Faustovirus]SME64932.1 Hypothetical protein FSTVST1_246 [Faustovirus ST1]
MTKVYIKVKSYKDQAEHKDTTDSGKLAKGIKDVCGLYPIGILVAKICCECVEDDDHGDCSSYEDYLIYNVDSPSIIDELLDNNFELYTDYDKFMDRFCELKTDEQISDILAVV